VREDAAWVREYVGPWVGRRLRGRSSGDLVQPKRPTPEPLHHGDVEGLHAAETSHLEEGR
jgi:hypothetical protein